jgi:hypothetical protein
MHFLAAGRWVVLASVATVTVGCAAESPPTPAAPIQFPAATMQWRDGPASLPRGTRMMVLEGAPQSAGIYTLRLKVPKGTHLPPHWHPEDERVTVLSGRVGVGFGDTFDRKALQWFGAGSFYVNPARSHHYVYFADESVVQLTGVGPWQVQILADSKLK